MKKTRIKDENTGAVAIEVKRPKIHIEILRKMDKKEFRKTIRGVKLLRRADRIMEDKEMANENEKY